MKRDEKRWKEMKRDEKRWKEMDRENWLQNFKNEDRMRSMKDQDLWPCMEVVGLLPLFFHYSSTNDFARFVNHRNLGKERLQQLAGARHSLPLCPFGPTSLRAFQFPAADLCWSVLLTWLQHHRHLQTLLKTMKLPSQHLPLVQLLLADQAWRHFIGDHILEQFHLRFISWRPWVNESVAGLRTVR